MLSKIEPIDKDIELMILESFSPAERSALLAQFAIETLADAEATDTAALGYTPPHQTFVDGREGAAEESVRPDGVIVYTFDIILDLFAWIDDQLRIHSPVGSGKDKHPGLYQKSHMFFADGVEADPLAPPPAKQYAFVNAVPYARKIEAGESPQFPDGVYESVVHLAAQRYGNVAKIQFTWRGVVPGMMMGAAPLGARSKKNQGLAQNKSVNRYPAIIITVR